MALKSFNPTSAGRRFMTILTFEEITKTKPEKALTEPLKRTGGRDNRGRITIRFMGGGHKQRFRLVDFRRDKRDIPAKVAAIEYDPNRSARLALLHYVDGEKRYILWPDGVKVGQTVVASDSADILPGNCLPLRAIPAGTIIHNIELRKGKGAQMVRSAGGAAQLVAKEGDYARSSSLPVRSGRCTSSASRPWASLATSTTRTSRSGRPAARAGWVGAPTTVGCR